MANPGNYTDWRQALFHQEHQHESDDPTPLYALGVAALDRGAYEAAMEHFQAAVARQPHNSAAYQHLGRAARALGREAEARQWLRRGIEQARLAYHHYHRQEMERELRALDEG